MSPSLRRFIAILGGLLIAAGITWYPWTYWDDLEGNLSAIYGMSAMIWAPAAFIVGVVAGLMFAFALWPRRQGGKALPKPPQGHDDSSFEA